MMEHTLEYVVNFHEVVIILCKRKEIIKEKEKNENGMKTKEEIGSSWPNEEMKK